MLMPFGKFHGRPLTALEDSYLKWLLELPDLREPLASAVKAEVAKRASQLPSAVPAAAVSQRQAYGAFRRRGEAHPAAPSTNATPRAKLLFELIDTGLRVLSSKIAIDGSEAAKKVELDAAAAWLRRKVAS